MYLGSDKIFHSLGTAHDNSGMYLTCPIHSKGFQSWNRLIKYANVNAVLGRRPAKGLVWELDVGCTLSRGGTDLSHHIKVWWEYSIKWAFLLRALEKELRHGWMEPDKQCRQKNSALTWLPLHSLGILSLLYLHRRDKGCGCNSVPILMLEDVMTFPILELLCIGPFITN